MPLCPWRPLQNLHRSYYSLRTPVVAILHDTYTKMKAKQITKRRKWTTPWTITVKQLSFKSSLLSAGCQYMDASKQTNVRLALGASRMPPRQYWTGMLRDHANAGLHRTNTSRDTLVYFTVKAQSTSRFNSVVSSTYGLRPFVHYHSRLWHLPPTPTPVHNLC